METYLEFLRSKIVLAKESGFELDPGEVNPGLKPHQRDAVVWALRGGRRALFESFGLGKTVQEIEFCHQAVRHDGGRALIVLPLGVRQEFARDAQKILGYPAPVYITSMEDLSAAKKGYTAGDTATFTLYRQGDTLTVKLTFGSEPAQSTTQQDTTQNSSQNNSNYYNPDDLFDYFFGNRSGSGSGSSGTGTAA